MIVRSSGFNEMTWGPLLSLNHYMPKEKAKQTRHLYFHFAPEPTEPNKHAYTLHSRITAPFALVYKHAQ